uniref:Contactin-5 n=1 Tax=Sphaerodactylus townsendi TaxID=933632 RepID=A0ACB8FGZ8_9SAUR
MYSMGRGTNSNLKARVQVSYWKDIEQEEAAEKIRTEGNESSIILTGLEGNTLYHMRVKAFNAAGYGPPSNTVRAATKKSRHREEFDIHRSHLSHLSGKHS